MEEMDEISVANTYLVSVKNGILHIVINQDAVVDIDIAVEVIAARRKLQKDVAMLTLLDTRKFESITTEARKYTSSKKVLGLDKAMAILSGKSLPATIVGNFFIKFNKPSVPIKLFKKEENALKWLKSYR